MRKECRLRVLENRVLRRIFWRKRDEVTREWRKLHNEVLDHLYSKHNTVRVIKSRRIRWARHVACMGEKRGVYRVLMGKPEGKRLHRGPAIYGKIILRWIFRKWDVGVWTGSSWLRTGTRGGHL